MQQLEIVPRIFRVGGCLYLKKIHVAHDAAINAQLAIMRHEIIDGHLAHLHHDSICVIAASGLLGL